MFQKFICSESFYLFMLNFDEILLEFRDNFEKWKTLWTIAKNVYQLLLKFPEIFETEE